MASATANPPKRLGEFLKEQQEPFVLEIYLLERGCSKRWCFTPERGSGHNYEDSGTSLAGSISSCLNNKKRKALLPFSKVLSAVCRKLAFHNESSISGDFNKNNEDIRGPEIAKVDQIVEETDRFSSASCSTVFNSCSDIDEEEADHPSFSADTYQTSNVCNIGVERLLTMESTARDEKVNQDVGRKEQRIRSCGVLLPRKITEDALLSAALWGLLIQSAKRESYAMELRELLGPNVSQILKSKRVLQKTKQLLFDCVREIAVTLPRKGGQQDYTQLLGPEELGKLICEKTREWGRQAENGTNLTHLLTLDYLNSVNEWSDFEPQTKDISFEIADAILECINNEIVSEIIEICAPNR